MDLTNCILLGENKDTTNAFITAIGSADHFSTDEQFWIPCSRCTEYKDCEVEAGVVDLER